MRALLGLCRNCGSQWWQWVGPFAWLVSTLPTPPPPNLCFNGLGPMSGLC